MKIKKYFPLILIIVIISITQIAKANENSFPNVSISAMYTYSIDLNGDCILINTISLENLEDNFTWQPNIVMTIPIKVTSFSKEPPNVTEVSIGDNYKDINYEVDQYYLIPRSDSTYIHEYPVKIFPNGTFNFLSGHLITIRIKSNIKKISMDAGDYHKFIIYDMPLSTDLPPFKEYKDFTIRVNLPNDPYYWDELISANPIYTYRTPYGRGESVEWIYKENEKKTDVITIYYRIHPDPIKEALDNATISSLEYAKKAEYLGNIALVIAILSIPSVFWSSRDLIEWIKEKRNE